MRIIAISDTHCRHRKLQIPNGDILVHAGDFSVSGIYNEFEDFIQWFADLPHEHKIFIPGNHDRSLQAIHDAGLTPHLMTSLVESGKIRPDHNIHYLLNSSVEIMGKKFYGSPYQPDFCRWAFQKPRGRSIAAIWDKIPTDTDVLITHGPPYGHGDFVPSSKRVVGCLELMKAVSEIQPQLHIFGHIHESYGVSRSDEVKTRFINASICNEWYRPDNKPHRLDLE